MKELHQTPEYQQIFKKACEKKRGRKQSKEVIEKRLIKIRGQKRSEETKKKIGDAHRGKIGTPMTEETKKRMSIYFSGEQNPFFGKKHTKESREKMSINISKALKGKMPKNIDMFRGSFWWNDGIKNKRTKECPGQEWIKGKI